MGCSKNGSKKDVYSDTGLPQETRKISNEQSNLTSKELEEETKPKVNKKRDFPGGPVVKNPPSNAGDAGLIPGQGTKIPHAMGQLSLCATLLSLCASTREPVCHKTTEPTHSGTHAQQLQRPCALEATHHTYRRENPHATTTEQPTRRNERSRIPQRRSCMLQLRPNAAQKIKNK